MSALAVNNRAAAEPAQLRCYDPFPRQFVRDLAAEGHMVAERVQRTSIDVFER